LENYKTIKELAEEFDVSKQAIQQRLTSQFRQDYVVKVDKRLYINNEGYLKIKAFYRQDFDKERQEEQSIKDNENVHDERLFEIIKNLQNDNKELHKLLDQQQQLTLQSNKQIESLQQQLLLSNQSDEKEEETSDTIETPEDQSEPLEETVHEEIKSGSKKWWQLWK